jgi:hypothetical protein
MYNKHFITHQSDSSPTHAWSLYLTAHEEKMKQVEEMFQKYRADQPLVGGVAIAICAKVFLYHFNSKLSSFTTKRN